MNMATVKIKYSCGCGWRSDSEQEAIEHSDHFGHTIPVLGYIIPSENNKQPKQRQVVLTVEESYGKN